MLASNQPAHTYLSGHSPDRLPGAGEHGLVDGVLPGQPRASLVAPLFVLLLQRLLVGAHPVCETIEYIYSRDALEKGL